MYKFRTDNLYITSLFKRYRFIYEFGLHAAFQRDVQLFSLDVFKEVIIIGEDFGLTFLFIYCPHFFIQLART